MSRKPPTIVEARFAFSAQKRIDATEESVVLSSCGRSEFERSGPARVDPARWTVRFYSIDEKLRAMLYARGRSPVEALDFHAGRSRAADGSVIPPGYHWDVFAPLSGASDKVRLAVDTTDFDRYNMLRLVCKRWSIVLDDASQQGLL